MFQCTPVWPPNADGLQRNCAFSSTLGPACLIRLYVPSGGIYNKAAMHSFPCNPIVWSAATGISKGVKLCNVCNVIVCRHVRKKSTPQDLPSDDSRIKLRAKFQSTQSDGCPNGSDGADRRCRDTSTVKVWLYSELLLQAKIWVMKRQNCVKYMKKSTI